VADIRKAISGTFHQNRSRAKLKVLIVTQYFHPEPFRVNDLAVALHEKGHTVTVLTGMPNYPEGRIYSGYGWLLPAREDFLGISIIRVPLVPRGSSNNWRLILNYLSFVISSCALGPLRCRGEFDIVLVYEPSPVTVGLPGLLMGRIKMIPVMLWIQDLWPETLAAVGRHAYFSSIATRIANFVHRRCDLLLVQSEAFAQPLVSRGIPPGRIRYLPNWAEGFYKPGDAYAPAEGSAETGATRILFAGNIGAAQSFETILEAARLLKHRPDIHWIIAGDGLMRRWVEEQVRLSRLEATVTLLGRRPPAEMPSLYSRADALLVTLRRDPVFAMTIPAKIQSYLASGKVIVGALDGEGARTIRASGAGLVADAQDAKGLVQCVLKVAAMSGAERGAMGHRGREYFDQFFSRDKLIGQLESWMRELVGT
jgi:colanic acid biosynthesis glycosyl transferase WcaI